MNDSTIEATCAEGEAVLAMLRADPASVPPARLLALAAALTGQAAGVCDDDQVAYALSFVTQNLDCMVGDLQPGG